MTTSKGTRLSPDARREQLVELGLELLGHTPPDQVSIEAIARAAGISKGLLYHYFPTKSDFVAAVIRQARDEVAGRMARQLDADLTVGQRLEASIDAFLGYVDEHAVGFLAIARARGGEDATVRAAIAENRARRVAAMVQFAAALAEAEPADVESPALVVALEGWLGFSEGVISVWLERRREVTRAEVRHLIRTNLLGVLATAVDLDPRPAAARLADAAARLRAEPGQIVV
ncbi:MAG TPA: TetR/AcrR family transcriptional regulator [Baekduia sp.]